MSAGTLLWIILTAIVSFAAGWLLHNEKMRLEVFRKRFETYLEVNRLAADVLVWNVKASIDPEKVLEMAEARVRLTEFAMSRSLVISQTVGDQIRALTPETAKPDHEGIREVFNELTKRMGADMHLSEMQIINAALVNPIGMLERLRKRDGA